MRLTAIGFESKKLKLEGILTTPDGLPEPYPAILLCHSHPMLSGNMDSPVLTAISNEASAQGIATLRFNFRSVGESEGTFSNGKGEQDDARAAFSVLRKWPTLDSKRLAVAGYSFGAGVVLGGLKHYGRATSLVLIAPPISAVRESRIVNDKRPKLFIVGQNDRVSSSVDLQRVLDKVRQPVQFSEIADADHSLGGKETDVAIRVTQFIMESFSD